MLAAALLLAFWVCIRAGEAASGCRVAMACATLAVVARLVAVHVSLPPGYNLMGSNFEQVNLVQRLRTAGYVEEARAVVRTRWLGVAWMVCCAGASAALDEGR